MVAGSSTGRGRASDRTIMPSARRGPPMAGPYDTPGCQNGPSYADNVQAVVVHHTVTTNSYQPGRRRRSPPRHLSRPRAGQWLVRHRLQLRHRSVRHHLGSEDRRDRTTRDRWSRQRFQHRERPAWPSSGNTTQGRVPEPQYLPTGPEAAAVAGTRRLEARNPRRRSRPVATWLKNRSSSRGPAVDERWPLASRSRPSLGHRDLGLRPHAPATTAWRWRDDLPDRLAPKPPRTKPRTGGKRVAARRHRRRVRRARQTAVISAPRRHRHTPGDRGAGDRSVAGWASSAFARPAPSAVAARSVWRCRRRLRPRRTTAASTAFGGAPRRFTARSPRVAPAVDLALGDGRWVAHRRRRHDRRFRRAASDLTSDVRDPGETDRCGRSRSWPGTVTSSRPAVGLRPVGDAPAVSLGRRRSLALQCRSGRRCRPAPRPRPSRRSRPEVGRVGRRLQGCASSPLRRRSCGAEAHLAPPSARWRPGDHQRWSPRLSGFGGWVLSADGQLWPFGHERLVLPCGHIADARAGDWRCRRGNVVAPVVTERDRRIQCDRPLPGRRSSSCSSERPATPGRSSTTGTARHTYDLGTGPLKRSPARSTVAAWPGPTSGRGSASIRPLPRRPRPARRSRKGGATGSIRSRMGCGLEQVGV